MWVLSGLMKPYARLFRHQSPTSKTWLSWQVCLRKLDMDVVDPLDLDTQSLKFRILEGECCEVVSQHEEALRTRATGLLSFACEGSAM